MNILFLTIVRINDINERGIYTDLLREFWKNGHNITVISPAERRFMEETVFKEKDGVSYVRVKTLNIQKSNILEKSIGLFLIQSQFLKAIEKYCFRTKYDLVLYSTPPISFTKVIRRVKKRNNAYTYLLLKDIFPQNAIDLGMISRNGIIHRFFRHKEKKLFMLSDYIGAMSPANVRYLISNYPYLDSNKIEVCPNSMEIAPDLVVSEQKKFTRLKYNIPDDDTVFIYGGNLGKPQGIDFLLEVLKSNFNRNKTFFVIVGTGTEFSRVKSWFNKNNPANALLLLVMPKDKYDQLVKACDVGMIFLDKRFSIPNYPSRLLSYLEFKMPVIAATDPNTDVGKIAEENGYGLWSLSGDIEEINKNIDKLVGNRKLIRKMGESGYRFLKENYNVENSYRIIMDHFK